MKRKLEGEALQLKLSFYLKKLKISQDGDFVLNLSNYEKAKENLNKFYVNRAKIILYQNRKEIFDMSDTAKLYHHESLAKYHKKSEINKIEIDGCVYSDQKTVQESIFKIEEASMSKSFRLDLEKCEKLFSFDTPTISENTNKMLEADVTKEEISRALKQLKPKASPGLDGIPSTLYSNMPEMFIPYLVELFNTILKGEKPPESMRTTIVQFLSKPKKQDSIKLEDKRKISILCTDFKLFETVLANRLNKAMEEFISPSQFAVKPRTVTGGITAARDAIAYASKNNIGGAFLGLDMKCGFDLLQMDFVYYSMKRYGFSETAVKIFKNIYSDAMAVLYINGNRSDPIQDLRETLRQGGSDAMQIFIIGVNESASPIS